MATQAKNGLGGNGAGTRVDALRELLGKDVLMLPWPMGSKGTARKWGHLRAAKMNNIAYLMKLEEGNIGVALGPVSGGLCSIDWDEEEWLYAFLDCNPALRDTLRTKGERGCNLWVRCEGEYPASFKMKLAASPRESVGEWRAEGNQTIISGRHPSGCDYSFIVQKRPVEVAYGSLKWPEGIIAHSAHSAHRHTEDSAHSVLSALSGSLKRSQAGSESGLFSLFWDFVPTERGQSDNDLWAMAGRLKTWEKREGRLATPSERVELFKSWWAESREFVDPSMDMAAYLAKWLSNCDRRQRADDETAVTVAWQKTVSEDLPKEAAAVYEVDLSSKMRLLIALCRNLQQLSGGQSFFLTCREAGDLIEIPFRTVAYWFQILCTEGGPCHLLQKLSTGSQVERKANEYAYLPLLK